MIASVCMTMVLVLISMFITRPASRRRRHRELLDLVQREADPREQGQHARLQEREEDPRHPDSVSIITRATLFVTYGRQLLRGE